VHDDSDKLAGGNMGPVERRGDQVVRESGAWTPAVHRLLTHLHGAGVSGIPIPYETTEDGREILSFVEGEVPAYPMPAWVWTDAALETAARLLRQVHDATAGASIEGPWRSPTHEPAEVICHNDFAPYNLVFDADSVVGAIDWDFASPGPRLWDLAYLAYRIVPLTTDDWGDGFSPVARDERLRRLLRAYGVDSPPREVLTVLSRRLVELADFTDRAAERLSRPDMEEHVRLYRRDAAQLSL
jgi:hypothetical protein